ncbi:MAG TPA: peptide-methionine (S)-S-oxide reductase MsrA [Burkholderiales bacterium]|nr:peptide-methionine (S)-S-oxide reductase MsrA [Burkholderiales bacterium]
MKKLMTSAVAAFAAALLGGGTALAASALPAPTVDSPLAAPKRTETAVLAGGCFWGVEGVFEQLKGVKNVTSGYAGGAKETAKYDVVSSGRTGHAESVQITYDPSQITYGKLLQVFFSVAHDPTEVNRQGPDVGTQYRSAIFYSSDEQKKVAQAYIAQLNAAKVFRKPIATELAPLKAYYEAEAYHQDFMKRNPTYPYIVVHDAPKVVNLQKQFPELVARKD